MKNFNICGILCGLFLLTLFVSCNDDDSPSYEKKNIDNPELLAALQKQGFTVNGKSLEVNAKVTEATKLNLSGSDLKSLRGLEFFSKLVEVDLSNNDFGATFDFAQLPAQVKKVNLSDNKIYDYKGLINVNFETANIQVLRKLDKLVLPYTARWNMEALPFYFKEKGAVANMQMQNKEGQPEEYNTLREVPDPITRKYIQDNFSSVMTEDGKIDISKRINTEQQNISFNTKSIQEANDIYGVEFIINSPFYKGSSVMLGSNIENKYFDIPYLKPQKYAKIYGLGGVRLGYIDWSSAESLMYSGGYDVYNLKTADYSHSKLLMQDPAGINQDDFLLDGLLFTKVYDLEDIKLPKLEEPKPLNELLLRDLPKFKSVDMSKINALQYLTLINLPMWGNVDFSSIKGAVDSQKGEVIYEDGPKLDFCASERICNMPSVKEFIIRMGKKNMIGGWNSYDSRGYDYRHFYEDNTSNNAQYAKRKRPIHIQTRKEFFEKFNKVIERQNSNK